MKVVYKGKEYRSCYELVKDLFENGKLKNNTFEKKELAKDLGVTFQSIHASLVRVINEGSNKVKSVSLNGNVSQETLIIREGEEVEDLRVKKIRVSYAPNIWGLPVTNPPIYVVDKNYKGDVYLYENENLNLTSELFTF